MDIKQAASAYNTISTIGQGEGNIAATRVKRDNQDDISFLDLMNNALGSALEAGKKAEDVSTLAVLGKTDINSLATAVSSAELVLQEVVAIRDKVISAYQQIMQMPV